MNFSPSVGRAWVRTPCLAPPTCRIAVQLPCHLQAWRHTRRQAWTGWQGWEPRTSKSSIWRWKGEAALIPWLHEQAKVLGHIQAADVASALGGLVSEIDKVALTGEFAEFVACGIRRAVSSRIAGWRDDDLAFTRDWGFDLAQIKRPVAVWQGGQDRMVPFAHGQWLAEHIPNARVRLYREEGHLSFAVKALDRIIDDLVAIAR